MSDPRAERHILYLVPSWFTLDRQLRGQLAYLAANGFRVTAAGEQDPRAFRAAAREGAAYRPLPLGAGPAGGAAALRRTAAAIRALGVGVVSACTKKGGLIGAAAARLCGRKSLYVVHGPGAVGDGTLTGALAARIEQTTCALADRVLFISGSNAQHYRGLCPARKAVLLGAGSVNGVDGGRFQLSAAAVEAAAALRARLGLPAEARVIGYVGRLAAEKGLAELAAMWAGIRARFPAAYLLVVSPPEIGPGLAGLVRTLEADPRVRFTGFLEDPVPAYAAMECLVLPSRAEGFGSVLIEAGAMEVPVVARRVVGCVDAVVDGETGLLVDPAEPGALTRAVARLLADPAAGRAMGARARRRCLERFRPETLWEGYRRLYEELFDELGRRR